MALRLKWRNDSGDVIGASSPLYYQVSFPGQTTEGEVAIVSSTGADDRTFDTLNGVKLYLSGPDVPLVQETWPYLTPLSGGFEISFDFGRNYTRFSKEVGHEADASTWIPLPQIAVGNTGADGTIGPFDRARFLARYVLPPSVDQYKLYEVRLTLDADIV